MIGEYLFVELAEISGRTLHVLKHVAEHEDANHLSRLSAELESFGRYRNLALPTLLELTSDTRIVRAIESAVRARTECAGDSHESQPGFTEEHAIAWRMELLELLGVFEVGGCQFTAPKVSKPRQAALRQQGSLEKHVGNVVDGDRSAPDFPQETGRPSQPSPTVDSGEQALQRLIDGALPQDERAIVIESIFSSQEATNRVSRLREGDAQIFIDAVHEVGCHFSFDAVC